MGKVKRMPEMADIYDVYERFMADTKYLSESLSCHQQKGSYYIKATSGIDSSISFGNVILNCNYNTMNPQKHSFTIISDIFSKPVPIFRYDVTDATHEDIADDIPLSERQIHGPHFHRFDRNGCFRGYQPDCIKNDINNPEHFDISCSFPYFCKTANITNHEGGLPQFEIQKCFNFTDDDPNMGVNFDDHA